MAVNRAQHANIVLYKEYQAAPAVNIWCPTKSSETSDLATRASSPASIKEESVPCLTTLETTNFHTKEVTSTAVTRKAVWTTLTELGTFLLVAASMKITMRLLPTTNTNNSDTVDSTLTEALCTWINWVSAELSMKAPTNTGLRLQPCNNISFMKPVRSWAQPLLAPTRVKTQVYRHNNIPTQIIVMVWFRLRASVNCAKSSDTFEILRMAVWRS